MKVDFTAGPNDEGRRLEAVVRRLLPQVSLGGLHKALRSGDIRLNGAKTTGDARVHEGDTLAIWDQLVGSPAVTGTPVAPPKSHRHGTLPLPESWIVYNSRDWLVVNKPSGVLVQGGPTGEPSLDDQVRGRLEPRLPAGLSFRPGPLHRLDRPTSGLVVFSSSLLGAQEFSRAMAAGLVRKTYWALLQGNLTRETEVNLPLERQETQLKTLVSADGKEARTTFIPLTAGPNWTWVQVHLEHGRTHQIRAHAAQAGHPLVGDTKYGATPLLQSGPRPWVLHAGRLETALFPRLEANLDDATVRYLEKTFKLIVGDADQDK